MPILLLGNALYDYHQLVYRQIKKKKDLDRYWGLEVKANKDQRMNYLNWVKEKACSTGDFYTHLGNKAISQKNY